MSFAHRTGSRQRKTASAGGTAPRCRNGDHRRKNLLPLWCSSSAPNYYGHKPEPIYTNKWYRVKDALWDIRQRKLNKEEFDCLLEQLQKLQKQYDNDEEKQ